MLFVLFFSWAKTVDRKSANWTNEKKYTHNMAHLLNANRFSLCAIFRKNNKFIIDFFGFGFGRFLKGDICSFWPISNFFSSFRFMNILCVLNMCTIVIFHLASGKLFEYLNRNKKWKSFEYILAIVRAANANSLRLSYYIVSDVFFCFHELCTHSFMTIPVSCLLLTAVYFIARRLQINYCFHLNIEFEIQNCEWFLQQIFLEWGFFLHFSAVGKQTVFN